jgi:nucleoside-diphosphate-sugar epimerase
MVAIMAQRVLVAGADGFIGHHLATFLKRQGHHVRGVDVKPGVRRERCG